MRATICKVIQENLDVATRSITEQVRLLLAEPLRACAPLSRTLIIVLDALDESDMRDDREGGALLPELAAAIRHPNVFPSVRLLVTSRSETRIRLMFLELESDAPHRVVQLHEIENSIVQEDIIRYLEYRLRAIPKKNPDLLLGDWPDQADLNALAARAGVLFIYAATLVRFIESELDNPERQLRSILNDTVDDPDRAYSAVDNLYLQILDRAVKSERDAAHRYCRRLRDVVGAVVLVREPMSIQCLAQVTGIEAPEITLALRQLTAVLIIPESGAVTVFHPSFPEFILDDRRCADVRFRVNPSGIHSLLAPKCLQIMNEHLRRDICDIQNPSLLNSEVVDLPERLRSKVSPELTYACRHWAAHLFKVAGHDDDSIYDDIQKFSREKILHWIELLSLLGVLHLSYALLDDAQSYMASASYYTEAAAIMKDVGHMIREFYNTLRESALRVYDLDMEFTPKSPLPNPAEHEPETAGSSISELQEELHQGEGTCLDVWTHSPRLSDAPDRQIARLEPQ